MDARSGPVDDVLARRRERSVPHLLRVAMVLGAAFGIFGTSIGLWGLFQLAVSDGPFLIGESTVPKAEFAAVAGPFLILYISACLTAGAASWALWKRKERSRALLVLLLAEFVLGDAAMLVVARRMFQAEVSELVLSVSFFTVLVALGLWYLFRKSSVVAYYDSVRQSA